MSDVICPQPIVRPEMYGIAFNNHPRYWSAAAAGEMAAAVLFNENPLASYMLSQEADKSVLEASKSVHKLREQAFERLCNTDPLTGLHNRRSIIDIYNLRQAKSPNGERRRDDKDQLDRYVLFIDSDNFKQINTERQYKGGDKVLVDLAKILNANIRTQRGDVAGRWGGDEFVLILEGLTQERVNDIATAVREEIIDLTTTTVSVGMCIVDPTVSLEETIENASLALTEAKEQGKNRSVFFGN